MRVRILHVLILVLLADIVACAGPSTASAAPASEEAKIEQLIAIVAGMKDAVFIRNGDEHSCADAAEHMRGKWKKAKGEIKTARDFIRVAASKSSMSGKPYLIKWKDGRQMTSGEFLEAELVKIEKKAS